MPRSAPVSGGTPEFTIQSLENGATLRLVGLAPDWPDYFWAELSRPGLECRSRVYTYEPRDCRFSAIFRQMADAWKGWNGEKSWESLDGGPSSLSA